MKSVSLWAIAQTLAVVTGTNDAKPMCVMYLTGQHNVVPEPSLVKSITHVELAFMRPNVFNQVNASSWPLFTTVENARSQFAPGTHIMVAIGGWGDTEGFSIGAKTEASRELFAQNIKRMIDDTGADGVDIDWEYPGGNGEDYKTTPNSLKAWEISAYPFLLSSIRSAIGPSKLLSAAVPGLPRDMLAFTPSTIPQIDKSLDFWNIMTYDMMNRRDNVTKHHTGVKLSLEAVDKYIGGGVSREKVNLGFAFYTKYFRTDLNANCTHAVGCKTTLMEDPITGADLGQTGGFSWHDSIPSDVATSFSRALTQGFYDEEGGGFGYLDEQEHIWWTFDTSDAIRRKFPAIVERRRLGGVFAWGLGEDAPRFEHLKALTEGFEEWVGRGEGDGKGEGGRGEL